MNSLKNHTHMGKISQANRVETSGIEPGRARFIILLLALCTALQMIGFGMIVPLFARKIGDFGGGMEVLATSLMAYSLAGMVAAPIMGTFADRYGRRPLLIGSLAIYTAAFSGYFLATTSWAFIIIRGFAGGLTAGHWPATMGIVADIAPENERAHWIGIISGGSSTGWIVGPLVGGFLYDKWGYGFPFAIAIGMNLISLLITIFLIPESHTNIERRRAALRKKRIARLKPRTSATVSFWASLPHPLLAFGILLFINLSLIFAWFFIEPHLPFYVYDELGWSTAQFGATVSFYGWASLIGSLTLSQSSDRFGRKPILVLGLVLHSAQYVGLMLTDVYWMIVIAFILAGLGEALINPALNASFLDITPEEHRARAMGINNAVGAFGNLSAPALVMLIIRFVLPQSVFSISAALILLTAFVVLTTLRLPSRAEVARDLTWIVPQERILAAQSALHGVAISASAARKLRSMA